jgi:hypothetical protein
LGVVQHSRRAHVVFCSRGVEWETCKHCQADGCMWVPARRRGSCQARLHVQQRWRRLRSDAVARVPLQGQMAARQQHLRRSRYVRLPACSTQSVGACAALAHAFDLGGDWIRSWLCGVASIDLNLVSMAGGCWWCDKCTGCGGGVAAAAFLGAHQGQAGGTPGHHERGRACPEYRAAATKR